MSGGGSIGLMLNADVGHIRQLESGSEKEPSTMNIANELFSCFVTSIKKEIQDLQTCGVLDCCHAEPRRGYVLNRVLQEATLRFFALRSLCEAAGARNISFDTERPGRIDLVLKEGGEEYAFEFKRWETDQQLKQILGKDHRSLVNFMKSYANHLGYSVIFTGNENKDQIGCEKFQHDKQAFYEDMFEECLGKKYSRCECRVIEFDTFTVCVLLAAPKEDEHGS
jgi:hypothetical protein